MASHSPISLEISYVALVSTLMLLSSLNHRWPVIVAIGTINCCGVAVAMLCSVGFVFANVDKGKSSLAGLKRYVHNFLNTYDKYGRCWFEISCEDIWFDCVCGLSDSNMLVI